MLKYGKRFIVSIIKRFFRRMGYEIVVETSQTATMIGGIQRAAKLGININTVIDIGASNGRWSELCMVSYPYAKYLLIEAQKDYDKQLLNFKNKFNNVDFVIAVASSKIGQVYFDASEVGTGIASEEKDNNNFKLSQATTIDYEIKKRFFEPPYLIKLDTHGFEVSILEGSKNTIQQTNLIVMETYNFNINKNSKRFHEMIFYMETLGFRCIDIVDIGARQKDGLLWQMDILFAKSDRPEFQYEKYK